MSESAAGGPRVAVIGAGLGGLAAALRLQSAGVATTLFEARDLPGGRAYVYHDQGFTFDAGPTVITAPSCLEELFALSGKSLADFVELIPNEPFYRILWEDGEHFDYDGDHDRLFAELERFSAADVEGYRRFYAHSERVFDAGYRGLVAQPFLRLRDMLRVVPQLARLRADRSVYETVSRFVRDERLRQVLSFHSLLIGGNPFESSSIYTLIHFLEREEGVFFVRGGTHALVRALAQRFEDLGGDLRLATPVRSIRVEPDGSHLLRVDSGTERFSAVVSNADLHHTYGSLYAGDRRADRMRRRLERMTWSNSLFLVYFGTDRRYPDMRHHTIILGPRYEGLLRDIFHGSRLPDDMSLYLHTPTVSDPSLAPEGCECFYVLSPVPHLGHAPIDWDREAPAYADRVLANLERFLPDLRKHVVVQRTFTPRDFERELGAHHGSAFSVAPILTQSAWFRPHNRDPRIPGLYIVGAGTHPGAGVPGVVNSAKATVKTLLEDFGR
ncbi:MAG: phytoene desaturase [Myxococcota bacterium]|nr:phytoene desaturase [Myxococcota bacterium]